MVTFARNLLLAGVAVLLCGNFVKAGGIGDDHGDDSDTIFFGAVKDTRGSAIAGARVNVKFKSMSFVTTSDAIGNYRIATTVDPDQSELSCSKEGYRQSGTMRRPPSGGTKSPVEIDCTLQPGR